MECVAAFIVPPYEFIPPQLKPWCSAYDHIDTQQEAD